jgi:hypothetical protein
LLGHFHVDFVMAKKEMVKVRVLMALPLDGRIYPPNTALELERKAADSLVTGGFVDSDPAAVEYALTQGELKVHQALEQENSPESISDADRDQPISE